jgi:hypothetical protein
VRRRFEQRFTAGRMARDYLVIYDRLISKSKKRKEVLAHFPAPHSAAQSADG